MNSSTASATSLRVTLATVDRYPSTASAKRAPVQFAGGLDIFRHGAEQRDVAPGLLEKRLEAFNGCQGVGGLLGARAVLASLGQGLSRARRHIPWPSQYVANCFTRRLAGHIPRDAVKRVIRVSCRRFCTWSWPVPDDFWKLHGDNFRFSGYLCGICAVNTSFSLLRGKNGALSRT